MDDNSRGSSNSMRGLVSGAPAQQLPVGGVLEPKTTMCIPSKVGFLEELACMK